MIKIIHGDITQSKAPIICHQVNCKGKMSSGVARAIRHKFARAYRVYITTEVRTLGECQFVNCTTQDSTLLTTIVNMFSQDNFGYDGGLYTDYNALRKCLKSVREYSIDTFTKQPRIALPYNIGCGLGGGDWSVVEKIIEEELFDCNVELWKLN